MKILLLAVPLALAMPVAAERYEPLNGAVSGRSPHTPMRRVTEHRVDCDAIRPGPPAGKLAPPVWRSPACAPDVQARNAVVAAPQGGPTTPGE